MQVSSVFMAIFLTLLLTSMSCEAQFFPKTPSSLLRMGRRTDSILPGLVKRMAITLRFVIDMVQEYDVDGNGELNPEELMEIPLIQSAVRNYMDVRDMRDQYTAEDEERRNEQFTDQSGGGINDRLIM